MANKKVEIKITGSISAEPFKLSYHVGDVVKMEEKKANELIDAGVAEYANPQKSPAGNCKEEISEALAKLGSEKDAEIAALKEEITVLNKTLEELKSAQPDKKKVKPAPADKK